MTRRPTTQKHQDQHRNLLLARLSVMAAIAGGIIATAMALSDCAVDVATK